MMLVNRQHSMVRQDSGEGPISWECGSFCNTSLSFLLDKYNHRTEFFLPALPLSSLSLNFTLLIFEIDGLSPQIRLHCVCKEAIMQRGNHNDYS